MPPTQVDTQSLQPSVKDYPTTNSSVVPTHIATNEVQPKQQKHWLRVGIISAVVLLAAIAGLLFTLHRSSNSTTPNCKLVKGVDGTTVCYVSLSNPHKQYAYSHGALYAKGHYLMEYDGTSLVLSGDLGASPEPSVPGYELVYDGRAVYISNTGNGGTFMALSNNGQHYAYVLPGNNPTLYIDGKKIQTLDSRFYRNNEQGKLYVSNDGKHYAVVDGEGIIRDNRIIYANSTSFVVLDYPVFSGDLTHYIDTTITTEQVNKPESLRIVSIIYDGKIVADNLSDPLGITLALSPNGQHYLYYNHEHYSDYTGRNGTSTIVVDGKRLTGIATSNPSSGVINNAGQIAIVGGYTDQNMEVAGKVMSIPTNCQANIDACLIVFNQDFSHYAIHSVTYSRSSVNNSWTIDGKSITLSAALSASVINAEWNDNTLYMYP